MPALHVPGYTGFICPSEWTWTLSLLHSAGKCLLMQNPEKNCPTLLPKGLTWSNPIFLTPLPGYLFGFGLGLGFRVRVRFRVRFRVRVRFRLGLGLGLGNREQGLMRRCQPTGCQPKFNLKLGLGLGNRDEVEDAHAHSNVPPLSPIQDIHIYPKF